MWWVKLLVLSVALTACYCQKVLIVGAGASGMAVAIRLLQNNFTDFLVIEAQDRIGGRVQSVKIGDGYVDLGAEYAHGDTNNIVHDVASESLVPADMDFQAYYSDGTKIDQDLAKTILDFTHFNMSDLKSSENSKKSFGQVFAERYTSEILGKYSNDPKSSEIAKDFQMTCEQEICRVEGCFSVFQPAACADYITNDGEGEYSWNGLGFASVFPLLEKAYLDQDAIDDLHKNKIVLNKAGNQMWMNSDASGFQVRCADGSVYNSATVVLTPSVAMIFRYQGNAHPPIPSDKRNALAAIGYSGMIKMAIRFSSNWWNDNKKEFYLVWKDSDLAQVEQSLKWVSNIFTVKQAPNNPNVMVVWGTGPLVPQIEVIPEDVLENGIKLILQHFFSKEFEVQDPVEIIRSNWSTNPYFLGALSYDTIASLDSNAREVLAEPVMNTDTNIPLVLFAGEAAHSTLHGSVRGAIESGFREADRILNSPLATSQA